MRGTLLNAGSVAAGSLIGLALGSRLPSQFQGVIIGGLGCATLLIGAKMFLLTKNPVIPTASIALGGVIGLSLRFQNGMTAFAEWARHITGGGGRFDEALITTSILYCVGPMTVMGCLQDGLEGKIELLALKSTLDGIGAIFFAAALGVGVLVTSVVVLVVQGTLTLASRPLRRFATDDDAVNESTAAGGIMLVAIGLGLLNVRRLPVIDFLPALALAPAGVMLVRGLRMRRQA